MCFSRQLHLQSIQVIFFIFLNKWFSVFWIQLRGHQGLFFLLCVWTCKGGITESNRMWCEMTASNVACHGSVRQTSLTSLQMENSLCCIVFHARGQVCSSLFLSALWTQSTRRLIDGIVIVYRVDFGGLFWLAALTLGVRGVCLQLWPFYVCDFRFLSRSAESTSPRGGFAQLAQVYSWSAENI